MGHLLVTSSHLTKIPTGHLAIQIPWIDCYVIDGYINGDIECPPEPPNCTDGCNSFSGTLWDGTFRLSLGPVGVWGVNTNRQVGSQSLSWVASGIVCNPGSSVLRWRLRVICNPSLIMWGGRKAAVAGDTPAGVYTREAFGGFGGWAAGPGSITIVECP